MTEFVQITKKYGVTGVIACWLWLTNNRVETLENKLVNCYQMQIIGNKSVSQILYNQKIEAIIPKKFKIKIS